MFLDASFWVPKKASKRYSRGGIWRGPATVLVREGHQRYFVSWRGRALLLATPNMRLATKEELAMNEPAKKMQKPLARCFAIQSVITPITTKPISKELPSGNTSEMTLSANVPD